MNEKTYNGWTNYETWCVALWINNDPYMQKDWAQRASDLIGDGYDRTHGKDDYSNAACELACQLKDDFEEYASPLEGFWSDWLNSVLSEVEWREISQSIIDSVEVDESEAV
jgi:hypothetical protein